MARVLLTGASSFTGMWIAESLVAAGHQVTALLRRSAMDYSGLRRERVERLAAVAEVVFEAPLGSVRLADVVAQASFDLLAHHAADIPNYRSATYDAAVGFARNIEGVRELIGAMADRGGRAVIATGTAFERGEGGEGPEALAVSPYGLSKSLTNETLRHFSRWAGLGFGKFVIAGPFGALEEGRFGWSMFQNWFAGRPGVVRTPRYVRDNLPVPLLGRAYVQLADALMASPRADMVARPQGFVGTQADFAHRLSANIAPRLGLACDVELMAQPSLDEPETRINSDPWITRDWDEAGFWDDYANYYRRMFEAGRLDARA